MQKTPLFLQEMLEKQYGKEQTEKIIEGYTKTKPVTLRINTIKTESEKVKEQLNKENIIYKEVEWYNQALIIENAREEQIKQLEIYKKRRNIFTKFIINDTTNNIRSKSRRKYIRYGSSTRRKNNRNISIIQKRSNDYSM